MRRRQSEEALEVGASGAAQRRSAGYGGQRHVAIHALADAAEHEPPCVAVDGSERGLDPRVVHDAVNEQVAVRVERPCAARALVAM